MLDLSIPTGIVAAEAAITIDGQNQPELTAGLLSLIVEETTEGLCRCEARFGNWDADYKYFDRRVLDFGKSLTVRVGADGGEGVIFDGRISAIEGQFAALEPPTIVVLAEDRLADLRTARRTRVFEDLSDADVFEQIARDHSLQPDIDVDGPTHTVLAQINQSDLAFIRERARTLDADVWVDERTLHVQARTRRAADSPDYRLVWREGLLEFSVTADLANQYSQVIVSGWDVGAKDQISAQVDASVLGSELVGDSGASIQEQAFGPRTDRLAHCEPRDGAEAQALAEAVFRAQARRFVYGTGIARGDARLRVGAQVTLDGLGPLFSGLYNVSEARHLFRRGPDGGYTTEFTAERPGLGRP